MPAAMEDNRFWLSLHIYHEGRADQLLAELLCPVLQAEPIAGAIRQFFFIRYFDQNGPHLRLRIEGPYERMIQEVEPCLVPALQSILGDYYWLQPAVSDSFEADEVPEARKIETLQYIPYIPETQRFGGRWGLQIAEQQFHASSKAVMDALTADYPEWNYDQAMGTALRLHLALLQGTGWPMSDIIRFLEMLCRQWMPMALSQNSPSGTAHQLAKEMETFAYYRQAFALQQNALASYIGTVWTSLLSGQSFADRSFENWRLHSIALHDQLRTTAVQGKLEARPLAFISDAFAGAPPDLHTIYHLYADFVHLTNNRLGIANRDEGFIAYILWQSLAVMS